MKRKKQESNRFDIERWQKIVIATLSFLTGTRMWVIKLLVYTVSLGDLELFYPIIFLLYYMFCCCICANWNALETPQQSVIRKFKKWLDLRGNKRDSLNSLMRLYAWAPNAVKKLESCRLNRDFTESIRNDLEFYIPQMLSFYLSRECNDDESEELSIFINMACKSEFFFSHRVLFFLMTV